MGGYLNRVSLAIENILEAFKVMEFLHFPMQFKALEVSK